MSARIDHGAKVIGKAKNFRGENNPKPRRSAMSKFGKDAHKRVARMLGFVLTLGDEASWWEFSHILSVRMTDDELKALAYSALMALEKGAAYDTAQAACFGYVGAKQ